MKLELNGLVSQLKKSQYKINDLVLQLKNRQYKIKIWSTKRKASFQRKNKHQKRSIKYTFIFLKIHYVRKKISEKPKTLVKRNTLVRSSWLTRQIKTNKIK